MNLSKVLIGTLTAVTLSVVAYVFVINPIFLRPAQDAELVNATTASLDPPGDAAPRVAIITPTTLDAVRVNSSESEQESEKKSSEKTAASGEDEENADAKSEDVATQLLIASIDHLSGNIANELSQTGRFEVVEPLRVNQVIDELARSEPREGGGDDERPQEQKADPETDDGFLLAARRAFMERFKAPKESALSGSRTDSYSEERPGYSASSESESMYRADLAEAAVKLGAKYILVVYVSEPRFESEIVGIPDTERHVHVVRADPVISYRLFEGVTGTVILSEVTSPSKPIEIIYDHDRPPVASAFAKAKLSLEKVIAEDIVTTVVDTVFPPQISSSNVDRITIDRGERDGVLVGDVFEISRDAGEAVGAGNIRLTERIREPIGSVRVAGVQKTISYVEPLTGGPFVRGDYLDVAGSDFERRKSARSKEQDGADGNLTADPPVLGARMAADRAGQADKPRLAVRELNVRYIDCASCETADSASGLFAQSVQTQLQNERRILVLSREDLDASLQEGAFADLAEGRSTRIGIEGMSSAHYLLSGSLAITPKSSVSTERVAGREVETGRTSSLQVSGEMRIFEAATMKQIEATSISFTQSGSVSEASLRRVMDRAANAAVSDLMEKLFPLAVLATMSDNQIEISGGQQAGLTNGARLQVYSIGETVSDLYSDQSSESRTKSGILIVSDVRRDRATARFSGKPFSLKRGDQLELISPSAGGVAVAAPAEKTSTDGGTKKTDGAPKSPDEF